ncbi:hypothetical protein GCM10009425_22260 [Pseudomonas asuensis]|uniref:TPM domain-containing protein n=2 Tax=Pseudomonas asuensis TaxID=1825787 RepID=A0ABQ2GT80_9PSED|nr:TPM domain-containing protein [Pseudomonas asuensis]GGM10766.1 hypothetical protein GCM10009425_22260 [Pseudomonas asuensis]
MMDRRLLQAFPLWLLLWACAAFAQAQQEPDFPPLTGRVVDQAGMLDTQTKARLEQMLKAHEQATTEQVVVATIPSLQGRPIEEYGYQLGRHWGIGQKGKDNGALLLVSRDDRKVRIEVGYGLEGRLTDAQSFLIINQVIVPRFRQGQFTQGISEGTGAMLKVLGGDPLARPTPQDVRHESEDRPTPILFIVLFIIILFMMKGGGGGRGGRGGRGNSVLTGAILGSILGGGGRSGGGGFGGGGFGGGGGSFGGGGASGDW